MVSHNAVSRKSLKISKPSLKTKASRSLCEYMLWNIYPVLNETTGITRSKMLMTLRTISKKLGRTVQKMHKTENLDIQFGCNMAIGCKLNEPAKKYTNYEASSSAMFSAMISNVFDTATPSVTAITQKDQRMGRSFEDEMVTLCSDYFKSAQYSLVIQPSLNPIASQIDAKILERVKGRLTEVKCQLEDIKHLKGVVFKKITVNEQRSNQKYYAPILAADTTEITGLSLDTFRDLGYTANPSVKKLNCRFTMENLTDYYGIYQTISSTFPNVELINLETDIVSLPSGDDDEQICIEDFLQPIIESLREINESATLNTAVKLQFALDEKKLENILCKTLTDEFEKFGLKRNDYWSYKNDLLSVNIEVIC